MYRNGIDVLRPSLLLNSVGRAAVKFVVLAMHSMSHTPDITSIHQTISPVPVMLLVERSKIQSSRRFRSEYSYLMCVDDDDTLRRCGLNSDMWIKVVLIRDWLAVR